MKKGDLIFFQTGKEGAHQFYNNSDETFKYLDLVVLTQGEACEYPDSNKINCCGELYLKKDKVTYYHGEEKPSAFWDDLIKKG